jgi:hypothetical protein
MNKSVVIKGGGKNAIIFRFEILMIMPDDLENASCSRNRRGAHDVKSRKKRSLRVYKK